MSILEYVGIFCTVWMATGLLIFIVNSGIDALRGVRNDGEWAIGLALCVGAGPLMLWLIIVSWADERRQRRRVRSL